ncbi:MAG: hypothetical protein HY904_06355 [Deltaproteobacteria bacterium]|nr:hypothetical protein [Deltaproteobacteria bacterium]
MGALTSTGPGRLRNPLIALALSALLGATGCLVSDKDLPCRADCHCPSGQACKSGTCKPGSPESITQGEMGGECFPITGTSPTGCNGTLLCHPDDCGKPVCRQQCSRNASPSGCPGGQVCEDLRTGQIDGGVVYPDAGNSFDLGVCVP